MQTAWKNRCLHAEEIGSVRFFAAKGASPLAIYYISVVFPALNLNLGEYFILIILVNPQVPFGNLVGRMVVNAHKESGLCSLLPGMVPKGFS